MAVLLMYWSYQNVLSHFSYRSDDSNVAGASDVGIDAAIDDAIDDLIDVVFMIIFIAAAIHAAFLRNVQNPEERFSMHTC